MSVDTGILLNDDTKPEIQDGIDLTPSAPSLPYDTVARRAARADFALGADSPGPDTMRSEYLRGNEFRIREQAASRADTEFRQQKLAAVQSAINKGAPLTDKDVNDLVNIGQTPEANPETVIEDKFAKNIVTTGIVGDPGKNLVFQTAFNKAPERTQEGSQIAMAAVSRKMQAKDVLEETEAAYNALPWVAFGSTPGQQDKLGSLLTNVVTAGIAQYVNQRNLVNSDPINSWLPGSNKLEQIQSLYRISGSNGEFKKALRDVAGPGSELFKKSPSDALDFVRAAEQFSTSDAYVENIYGVMNVAGLLPITSAARAIGRLRGAKTVESAAVATAEDIAREVLSASSRPPANPKNINSAMETAAEVLAGSPKAPGQRYYIPEAAVKRPWESQTRMGSFHIGADGKPTYMTDEGVFVDVKNTPEVGHIQVIPKEPTVKNQYTTKAGTFDFTPEGVDGKKTVYVDKAGYEKLSQVLDEEQNFTLLQDDKGRYFVGDLNNKAPGKAVKGSAVSVKNEPAEGLYPIHLPEGTDKIKFEDFGSRITRVDRQKVQNYEFGPTIVDRAEMDGRRAMADIVKSQRYDHPQDILSKMGMQEQASEVSAKAQIAEKASNTVPSPDPQEMRRRLPSNVQPLPYYDLGSSLSWKRASEILDEFWPALNTTRVERLTPEAQERAFSIARDAVKKYNRMSSDAIRDQITHWNPLTNLYSVETRIGKPNGELFDSYDQAVHYKNLQYRLGSSAEVQQEGTKFFLSHIQHTDDTQSAVRDALILGTNQTPKSWVNSLFAMATGRVGPNIRSSAYTVSEFQRQARTTATHAPSVLKGAIEEAAKDLTELGKAMHTAERMEVRDMLVHNRDFIPPGKSGKDRGFFYTSKTEFESEFFNKFNKLPTDTQWNAYETYTRLSDLDWVLRESEAMRDKARQGVRKYRMTFENRDGQKVTTDFIDAKEVKDFSPLTTADANIYIIPDNKFVSKYDLKDASEYSRIVNDKIKSGEYKILQMYSPRSKPMEATTGMKADIHFVVTNKFDERAIRFGENVEYRPGGHVIYQGQHYVKQPQIGTGPTGRLTHFGDTSLKAFETEKEAKLWAAQYDTARQLMKDGKTAEFDAFVSKNLPETPDELRNMFRSGPFNLDHPFMHTVAGRDTLQSNEAFVASNPQYKGLKDTFTAYNLAQNQEASFLQDRGVQLSTVANRGTEANPIWANVDAPLLDPYTSLSKGLGQVVRARWMTDYKHTAAESWIQEFGHLFDQSKLPLEKLRQNPLYYLYHVDAVDRGVIKNNPEAFAAMMTARDNILRFIGAKDEVGAMLDGLSARIVAGVDKTLGSKAAIWTEKSALPGLKSVPQFMRTATFDLVDGLFNAVQLVQQGLGATHALMVSPVNGMKGLTASSLVRWMQMTEDANIISRFGDIAEKMGWKKAEFLEAYDAWRASGVHNVGGEVSAISKLENPQIFKTTFGNILDKGRYFFKKGEEIGRDVAYFTAYHDWRDANPGRVLDNRARTEIQARFDTLSMNMTRASNAAYNEGILSIPTQFWTWNARFAEQMMTFGTGRQLTIAEKARVMAGNSMLWGVPSALGGATLGLVPYANYDDIRQEAIKRGINLSDKFIQVLHDGILQAGLNMVTGHETSLHRFSPNADQLRIFRDVQTGKKDWFELMFGASGSMAYKMLASVQPFTAYVMSAFNKDSDFKVTMNDLVNVAENSSAFNNYERAWVGWSIGRYISKNGQLQTEVDKFESVMLALGLEPQRVQDAWQMKAVMQARKDAQSKIEKHILEDSAIAFRAAQDGDTQTFNTYMARVKSWTAAGNFTHAEEKAIWKKAIHGQDSLVDNVNQQWLKRGPDMNKIPNVQQFFENLRGK